MNTDVTLGYLRTGHKTHNIILQRLERQFAEKTGYFIVVKDITKDVAEENFGKLKDYHIVSTDYRTDKEGDFYFKVTTNDARKMLEELAKKPQFFMFKGWKSAFDEAVIREL